ncbi:MAG: hypothetical protein ACRC42_01520 [Mycoplasma sp.]
MKISKSKKKILLFGALLIGVTAMSSTLVVACSNSSSPTIAIATEFKITDGTVIDEETKQEIPFVYTLTRSSATSIKIDKEITFSNELPDDYDGELKPTESFNTVPAMSNDFTKNSLAKQKAYNYFSHINNFSMWLQSMSNYIQDFLTATPTLLTDIDVRFEEKLDANADIKIKDLSAGLSTTLNEGANTARLGLHSVEAKLNLHDEIDNQTEESEFIGYDKKQWISEDVLFDYDEEKKTYSILKDEYKFNSEITDIKMNYNWWTTDSSNNVYWKDSKWNVEDQNQDFWSVLISKGFAKPQSEYVLGLNNMSFKWNNLYAVNEDKKPEEEKPESLNLLTEEEEKPAATKNYYPMGITDFVTEHGNAFQVGDKGEEVLINLESMKNFSDFLIEANKIKKGDELNKHFIDFVKSDTNKPHIDNIFKFIKHVQ